MQQTIEERQVVVQEDANKPCIYKRSDRLLHRRRRGRHAPTIEERQVVIQETAGKLCSKQ